MKFTLGTVQLGLDYGISNRSGKVSEEEAFYILDKAVDLGVDYFDTAIAYGQSEKIIGKWSLCRNKFPPIITKIHEVDIKMKSYKSELREQIESSLQRLNQSKLSCVMLHNYSLYKEHGDELLEALSSLVEEGLTDKVGVSVYSANELQDLLKYDFLSAFQGPFNLFDKDVYPLLERSPQIYYYARSLYLQGLFFLDVEEAEAKLPGSGSYLAELRKIAAKFDFSIAELAFGYVLSKPRLFSVVIGVENAAQLEENYALFMREPLPITLVEELDDRFEGLPNRIIKPFLWSL